MRFLVFIFISNIAFADNSDEAIKTAGRAFLKTEKGQQIKDRVETFGKDVIKKYIGKETAAVVGAMADIAIAGEVDLSKFNVKYKISEDGYIKPNVKYDIKNSEASGLLTIDIKY
jgi:hypothetical protein